MARAATPRMLRRLNAGRVLDAVRESGRLNVTELYTAHHISRPTVDAVADDLLRLGGSPRSGPSPRRAPAAAAPRAASTPGT